jgi:hypothetical protein
MARITAFNSALVSPAETAQGARKANDNRLKMTANDFMLRLYACARYFQLKSDFHRQLFESARLHSGAMT